MTLSLSIERTNTILYCQPWASVVAFYRDRLGLPIAWQNEWLVEFQLTNDSFVSVADAARASVGATTGQGLTLTWRVADVAQARAYLVAQGVKVTPIRGKWEAQVCYCHDPAGNRLEFWSAEKM